MTLLEVTFYYRLAPGERELQALNRVRQVYGARKTWFDEKAHTIKLEYDASRLTEHDLAALLRNAGIDIRTEQAMRDLMQNLQQSNPGLHHGRTCATQPTELVLRRNRPSKPPCGAATPPANRVRPALFTAVPEGLPAVVAIAR